MKAEKRKYYTLGGSEVTSQEIETEIKDLTEDDFEDEVDKFSDLYDTYEEKKKSDLQEDFIFFTGLFAITACILGAFVLTCKFIYRVLK